jgi:hypothetical protein
MSHIRADEFHGFVDNRYQHNMHTLAWIALAVIIVIGVGAGIFGFVWALVD